MKRPLTHGHLCPPGHFGRRGHPLQGCDSGCSAEAEGRLPSEGRLHRRFGTRRTRHPRPGYQRRPRRRWKGQCLVGTSSLGGGARLLVRGVDE
jgi:hypothetical protein